MKKYIILAIASILLMGYIDIIDITKYDFESFSGQVVEKLKIDIDNDIDIAIVPMDKQLSNMYDGLCELAFEDNYVIYINRDITTSRARLAFIHEMVHLRDMVNGDLERIPGTVNYIYKGKEYIRTENNKDSLPFEIEAINTSKKIYHELFPPSWLDYAISSFFMFFIVYLIVHYIIRRKGNS